jgi:hypothetical protein
MKVVEFVRGSFEMLEEEAVPKMVRSRNGMGWEARINSKTTTLAILGLFKACVAVAREHGQKFRKNKDFVRLYSRMLAADDSETATLLAHLVLHLKAPDLA